MLLSLSGDESDDELSLEGIIGDGAVGVKDEALLLEIADAVYRRDPDELASIRGRVSAEIDAQFLLDAIAVASAFNGITRVANATGIPLDAKTDSATHAMREQTGIEDFSEQRKSRLYD